MDFVEWLEDQLQQRDWSPADLARRSNIYPSTISRIMSRERTAGAEVCNAIARGLGVSPALVFQRAGLMDRSPLDDIERDETLSQLLSLAKRLSAAERRRLARVADLYLQEQQEQYGAETPADGDDGDKPSS